MSGSKSSGNVNRRKQNIASVGGIKARRVGEAHYEIYLYSLGCKIGEFQLVNDGQIILDCEAIEYIGKALNERWQGKRGSICEENRVRKSYYDIYFTQVSFNEYVFSLQNGFVLGWICVPNDHCFGLDIILIKEICKQLAYRYDLLE